MISERKPEGSLPSAWVAGALVSAIVASFLSLSYASGLRVYISQLREGVRKRVVRLCDEAQMCIIVRRYTVTLGVRRGELHKARAVPCARRIIPPEPLSMHEVGQLRGSMDSRLRGACTQNTHNFPITVSANTAHIPNGFIHSSI